MPDGPINSEGISINITPEEGVGKPVPSNVSAGSAETSIANEIPPSREVSDYSACWRTEQPEFVLIQGKKLSEIGIPLDMTLSNRPYIPLYLSKLMSLYEKSLGIVHTNEKVGAFESGKQYWERETYAVYTGLLNRLSTAMVLLNLLDPDDDPAVQVAKSFFGDISDRWKTRIENDLSNGELDASELPGEVNIALGSKRSELRKALTDRTWDRLKVLAEKLGQEVTQEGGMFEAIHILYADVMNRFDQKQDQLQRKSREKINEILYGDWRTIELYIPLVPRGVILHDEWLWQGFEKGRIKPSIYFPTRVEANSDETGGDLHVNAQGEMWRAAHSWTKGLYRTDEVEVPYPPNLESGYAVEIPFVIDEEVHNLTAIIVNNIGRVNPQILERLNKDESVIHSSEVVFIAPDSEGNNKIWLPSFSDTHSADFILAIKPQIEKVTTIKYSDVRKMKGSG